MEVWTGKAVECYKLSLMGHPSRNLEDSNASTNMDSGCLAHKISEGNHDCISNWQRGHLYDILARIWLNSDHVLKICINPNLNIIMIQFL